MYVFRTDHIKLDDEQAIHSWGRHSSSLSNHLLPRVLQLGAGEILPILVDLSTSAMTVPVLFRQQYC